MHARFSKDPRDRSQQARLCDHPDCLEDGLHPAPKSRDRLRDYFWFCKTHAREYNTAWDYCRGMGQAEIDRIIRQDVTWGRPTWPLGLQKAAAGGARSSSGRGDFAFDDGTTIFDDLSGGPSRADGAEPDMPDGAMGGEIWAFRVLGLSPPLTLTGLKARYKDLAKRLHPDLNGGDKEAEERLKRINLAYATLRANLTASVSRS